MDIQILTVKKWDFIPLKIITAEQLNLDNNSYKI